MNESGDDPAPPNVADSPPPLGDCSNTATPRMMQSMTRRTMMNVYIWRGVSVIGVSSEDYEAYAPRSSANDSRPDIHVETRAAHEHAVDLGRRNELGGVLGVHASAIQHAQGIGLTGERFAEVAANGGVHDGGVFGLCRFAGADSPDRLVRHEHGRELRFLETADAGLELSHHDGLRDAALVLVQALAHAEERSETGAGDGRAFARGHLIGRAKELTSLRVADQRDGRPAVARHEQRGLAREGALLFPVHVLHAYQNVRAIARQI